MNQAVIGYYVSHWFKARSDEAQKAFDTVAELVTQKRLHVEVAGRLPLEGAGEAHRIMIANTVSSVTSSPMNSGRRPLNGSCCINSRTPVALVKPECLISQTNFPGSTSIGALGRSARISETDS